MLVVGGVDCMGAWGIDAMPQAPSPVCDSSHFVSPPLHPVRYYYPTANVDIGLLWLHERPIIVVSP
jgi:hypothetical protein